MSDTIFVVRKTRDFTQIPNSLLNDASISFTAKGVLCYLLSKPDGWKLRVSDIEKHSNQGERAIRSALNELRDAGYAEYLAPATIGEGGKWKVSENPIFSRRCCFSNGVRSNGVNSHLSNTDDSNTDNSNTESPIASGVLIPRGIPTREDYEDFCASEGYPITVKDYDTVNWRSMYGTSWHSFVRGLFDNEIIPKRLHQ